MMDFSQIFEEWEKRGQSSNGQGFDPDKDAETPRRISRSEMEKARVEAELDLHGMTREAAVSAVRAFLGESASQGLRKVLIIHGKGLHSENNRGVLAEAVSQVLLKNQNVSASGRAAGKDGGRGASWVWLSARGK